MSNQQCQSNNTAVIKTFQTTNTEYGRTEVKPLRLASNRLSWLSASASRSTSVMLTRHRRPTTSLRISSITLSRSLPSNTHTCRSTLRHHLQMPAWPGTTVFNRPVQATFWSHFLKDTVNSILHHMACSMSSPLLLFLRWSTYVEFPPRTSVDISFQSQQLQVFIKDPNVCTNDTSTQAHERLLVAVGYIIWHFTYLFTAYTTSYVQAKNV